MKKSRRTTSAPCEGLAYDIEAMMQRTGFFALERHRSRGHMLLLEATWTPPDDTYQCIAELRTHFFTVLGGIVGSNTVVNERREVDKIVYYVITGDGDGDGGGRSHPDHILEVQIVGALACNVLARYEEALREAKT